MLNTSIEFLIKCHGSAGAVIKPKATPMTTILSGAELRPMASSTIVRRHSIAEVPEGPYGSAYLCSFLQRCAILPTKHAMLSKDVSKT